MPATPGRCLYHRYCHDKDTQYYLPDADVYLCAFHLQLFARQETTDGIMRVMYRRELIEQSHPGQRLKTVRP